MRLSIRKSENGPSAMPNRARPVFCGAAPHVALHTFKTLVPPAHTKGDLRKPPQELGVDGLRELHRLGWFHRVSTPGSGTKEKQRPRARSFTSFL